jgi:hypothetical protein
VREKIGEGKTVAEKLVRQKNGENKAGVDQIFFGKIVVWKNC